jgi:hypothetical protein
MLLLNVKIHCFNYLYKFKVHKGGLPLYLGHTFATENDVIFSFPETLSLQNLWLNQVSLE